MSDKLTGKSVDFSGIYLIANAKMKLAKLITERDGKPVVLKIQNTKISWWEKFKLLFKRTQTCWDRETDGYLVVIYYKILHRKMYVMKELVVKDGKKT